MAESVAASEILDRSAVEKAAHELARLHEQAAQARVVLALLRQDVTEAESRLGSSQAAQLLEANEQLVLAAMRAQAAAETSAQALKQASRSAELDVLTGLPNRVLLLDRFARAIAFAKRHRARLALLFVDLDNFKQINDTLGHAAGDQVLELVAHRLAAAVREADTVSRYGGDEFVILLAEVSHASDVGLVADKLSAALGAPSRIGEHVLRLTASMGIAIYPDDGEDAATLIDRADAAMYSAKRHGRGGFAFHGDETDSDRSLPAPALESLQQPSTSYKLALAEHERRHGQLREANEKLVLAALGAQELEAAADHARRRQTDFLGVLAHELRNPLTPIRNAAALLGQASAGEPLLPRLQAVIERQVVHMSRLLDDLLDISRASTGKLRLECRVIEMAGIIDQVVDACRPAMDTRLQRFGLHLPSCAMHVNGDAVRLAQIFSNLLDNASKYTPEGGEIGLSAALVDEAVVITVSDSGIGITDEALPHVFEPFMQDSNAVGFNSAGLGIGLTVVRELVEAHGGKVVASSVGSGLGSQFVVTLPRAGPPRLSA